MAAASIVMFATACKKDAVSTTDGSSDDLTAYQSIAVGRAAESGDSIYVVNVCDRDERRTEISFSSLPSTASSYLSANYSGYNAVKAYQIKNDQGTTKSYIAIIDYSGNPVGVKFDANGNFVKVLEQREGHDMHGQGWHHGGHFDDRDGRNRDTIALSALPSAITAYFASNYPSDTLIAAFRNRDNSIVVISANSDIYSTLFNASGNFVKRMQVNMHEHPGHHISVNQNDLPSNVQSYLSSTYPNYVFKRAFRIMAGNSGNVKGYVVLIDANNTKYAVEFDGSGSFVRAITIR